MTKALDRAHSTLVAVTFGRGAYALPLTPRPTWALWSSATRVARYGAVYLRGTDGPAAAGQRVTLQRQIAGTLTWSTVSTTDADSIGRFSFRVTLSASTRFRVLLPALGQASTIVSNVVTVTVR